MYCRYCGKELPNDSNFCPNCGKKQNEDSAKQVVCDNKEGIYVSDILSKLSNNIKQIYDSSRNKIKRNTNNDEEANIEIDSYKSTFDIIINGENSSFWQVFSQFFIGHKIYVGIYLLWVVLNLCIMILSYMKYYETGYMSNAFYPFNKSISDICDGYAVYISFVDYWDVYDIWEFFVYTILIPALITGIIVIVFLWRKKNQIRINQNSRFYYLKKRMGATLIDKVILLVASFFLVFAISFIEYILSGGYDFISKLGTFSAIFHMSTDWVYNVAVGFVMKNYPGDVPSSHLVEISSCYTNLILIDILYVSLFALINAIYYGFFELKYKATIGKRNMKMSLIRVKNNQGYPITPGRIMLRAAIFFTMIVFSIVFRWLSGYNYYIVIIVFFLLLDIPVLFSQKSLLDILSGTRYIFYKYPMPLNKNKDNNK